MFCPKCNYTSFDHLPSCPKCAFDWSQQKKAFNVEWMVPTAAEGMSIFTPASASSSQTGQAESLSGPAAQESVGEAATGEQEIDLDFAEMEEGPERSTSSSQGGKESEDALIEEVDEEISFEGLQDFSSDLNMETEPSPSAEAEEYSLEDAGSADNEQEPELEIEIDDQGFAESGVEEAEQEGEEESLSVDQDDLDLDITSILDELDSDSQDKESNNK